MQQRVLNAATVNIYQMPDYGDHVLFADGSRWALKQNGRNEWGLYDLENGVLHSAIGSHAAMVGLCAAVNQQDQFLRDLRLPINDDAVLDARDMREELEATRAGL